MKDATGREIGSAGDAEWKRMNDENAEAARKAAEKR